MTIAGQIAEHIRKVHSGENWTSSSVREAIEGVTWQQATTQVQSFNTIATLVFHTHYFVRVVSEVLEGKPLDAHDKFSFDHPPIKSQQDWDSFIEIVWHNAERMASLVEKLPDEQLLQDFGDGKYGNWYRNLVGVIEHLHYHLGQIVLIRKLLERTGGGQS